VAPYIAAAVAAEFATPTAGAVTVTIIAVTGSTTEAVARVIAANAKTRATGPITAVAGKCAGGKTKTSESKENYKNKCSAA
jgi:hypothetical protein